MGLLGPCCGWREAGQGQKHHWASSSTEPMREPDTGEAGTDTRFELRSEAGVAGPMPPPTGNWKHSQ